MSWEKLEEFVNTMDHWSEVQHYLETIGAQRTHSTRLVAFGRPHLADDTTLILPNGPARDQMGDGEIHLSVTEDEDGSYSLRRTGYERANTFTASPEWNASTFELVGKYILVQYNSSFRRKVGASEVFHQWLDKGLAPRWNKEHMSETDVGVNWWYRFTNTSMPSAYFYDYDDGDSLTFPLSMSYDDLTATYMKDVPQPPR